ncbi:hypothetical protein NYA22BAC_02125 [Parasphingorhabdus sp. NYA22]
MTPEQILQSVIGKNTGLVNGFCINPVRSDYRRLILSKRLKYAVFDHFREPDSRFSR